MLIENFISVRNTTTDTNELLVTYSPLLYILHYLLFHVCSMIEKLFFGEMNNTLCVSF